MYFLASIIISLLLYSSSSYSLTSLFSAGYEFLIYSYFTCPHHPPTPCYFTTSSPATLFSQLFFKSSCTFLSPSFSPYPLFLQLLTYLSSQLVTNSHILSIYLPPSFSPHLFTLPSLTYLPHFFAGHKFLIYFNFTCPHRSPFFYPFLPIFSAVFKLLYIFLSPSFVSHLFTLPSLTHIHLFSVGYQFLIYFNFTCPHHYPFPYYLLPL